MKKSILRHALLFVLASALPLKSFAWDNSVQIGYGQSHDPNHTRYTNSGFLLTGDLYPIHHSPYTYWSLTGALGRWYTSTPVHKHLTTVALSVALRVYPWTTEYEYRPYILGSLGPAYLSTRHFGYNTQGANAAFQVNAGLGVELNKMDLNFRFSHYSNGYLAKPDQGFTVLYLLSLGYLI